MSTLIRYIAPIMMVACVFALDWINEILGLLPPFSSVSISLFLILPLAEQYYLWQRPGHFSYTGTLAMLLLCFHATLAVDQYLTWHLARGDGSVAWADLTQWTRLVKGIFAIGVGLAYVGRTWAKAPRRRIDLLKLLWVECIFLAYGLIMILEGQSWWASMAELSFSKNLGRVVLVSSALMALTHLYELFFLPEPKSPDNKDELIGEIGKE
ncbi:MAG: hypothetical protein AAF804_01065 [Bacteroidota bacterium]